jgi:hypothetical protein
MTGSRDVRAGARKGAAVGVLYVALALGLPAFVLGLVQGQDATVRVLASLVTDAPTLALAVFFVGLMATLGALGSLVARRF